MSRREKISQKFWFRLWAGRSTNVRPCVPALTSGDRVSARKAREAMYDLIEGILRRMELNEQGR